MDEAKAKELAIAGLTKAAEALGLPPTDPAVIEAVGNLAHMAIDALGGRVYRDLHAKAVAEAEKIKTVADAERSRQERLKDR